MLSVFRTLLQFTLALLILTAAHEFYFSPAQKNTWSYTSPQNCLKVEDWFKRISIVKNYTLWALYFDKLLRSYLMGCKFFYALLQWCFCKQWSIYFLWNLLDTWMVRNDCRSKNHRLFFVNFGFYQIDFVSGQVEQQQKGWHFESKIIYFIQNTCKIWCKK